MLVLWHYYHIQQHKCKRETRLSYKLWRVFPCRSMMRFWELDLIKGSAILLVIFFHFIFDIAFFVQVPINLDSWLWWSIARLAASTFIFTSGISLAISFQKSLATNSPFLPKLLARSAKLLGIGALISLSTWLFIGEGTIIFGILHFLAIAPLVAYFFLNKPLLTFTAASVLLLCTPWVQAQTASFPYLVWLGLEPADFYSLDHFPLIPWLSIYLLGVLAASFAYSHAQRQFKLPQEPTSSIARTLSFLGKHTLLVYLAHQPLLLGLLYPFMH